jgi:hypothetical protein
MKSKKAAVKAASPAPAAPAATPHPLPTNQEISLRAHHLWEQRGCPPGCDKDFWFEAERQLGVAGGRQCTEEDAFADRDVFFNEDNQVNSPVERSLQRGSQDLEGGRRSVTAL